jgi:hypothetical protein
VSEHHVSGNRFGRLALSVVLLAGPLAVLALVHADTGSSLAQVLYAVSFLWLVIGAPYLVAIVAIEIRDLVRGRPAGDAPDRAGHRPRPSKDRSSCASAPPP